MIMYDIKDGTSNVRGVTCSFLRCFEKIVLYIYIYNEKKCLICFGQYF